MASFTERLLVQLKLNSKKTCPQFEIKVVLFGFLFQLKRQKQNG